MTTRHRIVILGAGTGGTLTANRLHKVLGDSAEIVVVDRDDRHIYQPALLFVPFGLADPEEIVRARHAQIHDGIEFRIATVDRVETSITQSTSATARRSHTTCSSSRPAHHCCRMKPRG